MNSVQLAAARESSDFELKERSAAGLRTEPAVAIVIVHYNCLADTKRCLDSLSKLNYGNKFCVIVDGGSPDGSGADLEKILPPFRCEVLFNPRNDGFAASTNLGISLARAQKADYIWLLNPDTSVHPEALRSMVRAIDADKRIGAVGGKVYYAAREGASEPDDRTIWSAGAELDLAGRIMRMRGTGEPDKGQYDSPDECGYLPGCSLMFRTELLESAGYLPEDYFMYFEETEWCARIRNAGFRLCYVPESVIWHHFEDKKMDEAFTVYYYNRNEKLFWFRHSDLRGRLKLVREALLRSLPRAIYAYLNAPDQGSRRIFGAHIWSNTDFLLGRLGRRF